MSVSQLGYIQKPIVLTDAVLSNVNAPDSYSTSSAGTNASVTSGAGYGSASTATGTAGGNVVITGAEGGLGLAAGRSGSVSIVTSNGVATNGSAGVVRLAPGLANGTGYNGAVLVRAPSVSGTVATAGTLTAKLALGGYIVGTGAGGIVTTCTGTELSAAIPSVAAGDMFELYYDADGTTGTHTITAGASGMTVIGTGVVPSGVGGVLKFICTAANTWKCLVVPAV